MPITHCRHLTAYIITVKNALLKLYLGYFAKAYLFEYFFCCHSTISQLRSSLTSTFNNLDMRIKSSNPG